MLNQSDKRSLFEQLFKKNYSRLCGLAYQYLNDVEESKDVVNDIFEIVWNKFHTLQMDTVDTYLMTIVRNRCLNLLEHRKVQQQYEASFSELDLLEEEMDWEDRERTLEKIESVCKELPDKTRYILSQCYFHHKTYKEVASELQIAPDAVKKHIVKALKILREAVQKSE